MSHNQNRDVLAISMHVLAAASLVTIQTQQRMRSLTDAVLKSVHLCIQIAQTELTTQDHKNNNNNTFLHIVIEEKEEDYNHHKDSNTKSFSLGEAPRQSLNKEMTCESIEPNQQEQQQSDDYFEQNNSQRKISLLSQQLSQIKVDKQKEAIEDEELLKLVEQADPESLIPRMSSIEVYDEAIQQSVKKEALIFNDQQVIIFEETKQTPAHSQWYETSPIQYRATSYNTNESSNLDHHSYRWGSDEEDEQDILYPNMDFGFPSSVFDFPFPEGFNENSVPFQQPHFDRGENQQTPKKKRLFCNEKKVPHWAENLEEVSMKQIKQQNLQPEAIFGRMGQKVLVIAKAFTDKKNLKRGSSARWDISQMKYEKYTKDKVIQQELMELSKLQKENAMQMRQRIVESRQNMTLMEKTHNFINTVKEKLFSSKKKLNQLN